jgi:hypothetical protein
MEVILRLFKKSILLLFVFSFGFLSAQNFADEYHLLDNDGLISMDFINQRISSAVELSKTALGATKSNNANVVKKEANVSSSKDSSSASVSNSVSKNVKKTKEQKTKSISLKNGFSHSVASDNKRFGYSLTLSGSMVLPKKISLNMSVGFHNAYHYGETQTNPDNSTSDVDYNVFDGSPISTTVARSFQLPKKINLSTAFTWVLPVTSKFMWNNTKIYSIFVPSLGLSRSFKLSYGVNLSLSYGLSYSQILGDGKVFGKETYDGNAQYVYSIAINTFSNSFSLTTTYKKVSLTLSTGISSGRKADSKDDVAKENGVVYQKWNHSVSYGITASYPYKDFSFSLGINTAGPVYESGNYKGFDYSGYGELVRRETVKGMLAPFDARYTKVLANIGYRFGF